MRLEHIAGLAFSHVLGRMLRRALLLLLIAASAIVAIYQFTVAGSLVLETHYDAVHAKLVVGAAYTAIALVLAGVFWALRHRNNVNAAPQASLVKQREVQLVMLVEALMLGYSLARRSNRTP
ncbi:MAG TPA: hypothetical protein VJR71_07345 [Pseudolabrys sp.]|nr:hypothetical protein [Pseudolabrys sp.]